MVHPYFGKGERISVAFNVSVEEKLGEAAEAAPGPEFIE
jgi:hypothetical protein